MDNLQKTGKENPTSKDSITREKLVIGFASVFEALFLLLELYFMIHADGNFSVLIVIAICMVLVLFFLVMAIIDLNQKIKNRERQEYEDIYKAQKASYLATRKYFDEIGERLSALEQNTTIPAEDIISAQKAMAKVTISRSKENAEALMNANDELIQRVFGFEEKLTDSNEEMIRQQQDFIKQTKEDMEENQRRIQDQFDALQTALQQMQQSRSFAEPSPVNVPQEDNSASEELPSFDMPVEEELPIIGDMEIEEELPSLDEIEAEEELPVLDEAEEDMPSLDDINLEDLPSVDEMDIEDLPVMEEQPEEEIPEMVEMPDLSDPNKQLSADEIAALFANAESIAEPEPAPEPEPEPEPAEEKPPMPDLSDPNKTLSPDEIAALFANM